MLIKRTAVAVRTLSVRTDEEMYEGTKALASALGTDPSTIVRIALADILARAQKGKIESLAELMHETV